MIPALGFKPVPTAYPLPVSFKGRSDTPLDRFIKGEIAPRYIETNSGTNGKVAIIKEKGHKPFVVKSSHKDPFNPETGLVQRAGVDFDNEAYILARIPDTVENSTKLIGTKSVDGVNYMAISYIDGKNPYAEDAPKVTMQHVRSCKNDLFELDKGQILHRDLIPENILITRDGKLNITDYGAGVTFEEMDKKQADPKYAHLQSWPYSNINAFEELFIMPYCRYLADKGKKDRAKKLFVGFLKEKGDFHEQKAISGLSSGEQKMTELTRSKIFSRIKPDDPEDKLTKDVTELEVSRINIRMAQKIARLYDGSGVMKNSLTSFYWRGWSGVTARHLINKTESLKKEYKDDPEMLDFLRTEREYAEHNIEKVFRPTIKNIFGFLNYCITGDKSEMNNPDKYKEYDDEAKREAVIDNIISEGIRAPMFNQVDGRKTNNKDVNITTIYVPQRAGIFH